MATTDRVQQWRKERSVVVRNNMKTKILHIHSDYPDGRTGYPSTRAVSNLVAAADNFEHYVLSINRTSNPFKVSTKDFADGISFVYWCIPVPGLYRLTLWMFCKYLSLRLKGLQFDILHGHKLTIDGLVASYLAKKMAKPYCLSVRGGTDVGYIRRFSAMNNVFASVLSGAECVFWLAPWTRHEVCRLLGVSSRNNANLPNFCKIPQSSASAASEAKRLFTVANYKQFKRKALLEIIEAVAILRAGGESVTLDIYGSGDEKIAKVIAQKISDLNLQDSVFIKGQVEHAVLIENIHRYLALVLPSVNETFGMVFVESLAAKVPFIGHRGSGVDGYFDDEYAIYLNSQKPSDIEFAVRQLIDGRERIYAALNTLHKSGRFLEFTAEGVIETYTLRITRALDTYRLSVGAKQETGEAV